MPMRQVTWAILAAYNLEPSVRRRVNRWDNAVAEVAPVFSHCRSPRRDVRDWAAKLGQTRSSPGSGAGALFVERWVGQPMPGV